MTCKYFIIIPLLLFAQNISKAIYMRMLINRIELKIFKYLQNLHFV